MYCQLKGATNADQDVIPRSREWMEGNIKEIISSKKYFAGRMLSGEIIR